jgi:hypothetical protein
MKTTINSRKGKLTKIKDLVSQFRNSKTMWPHQLEKKVAKILALPKGYSQELYYERLELLSSQTNQSRLNN